MSFFKSNNDKTPMPPEYIDYLLCKKFGWTPVELDMQPQDRIIQFLTIMKIEGAFENIEMQKLEKQMQSKTGAANHYGGR